MVIERSSAGKERESHKKIMQIPSRNSNSRDFITRALKWYANQELAF